MKKLAFIILLKRFKNNSVLFQRANYKYAAKFSMSPATFKKYFKEAIDNGHVFKDGDIYKVEKFSKILSDFYQETGLALDKHEILQGDNLNFKNILSELQGLLVVDNVIKQQLTQIDRKRKDIRLIKFANKTEKSDSFLHKSEMKRLRKLSKDGKLGASYADQLSNSYRSTVITSARHTAKKLGVSVKKANQILSNSGNSFKREILVKWVYGISIFKIEKLRHQFPNATIIPMMNYNRIKICFGSSLFLC